MRLLQIYIVGALVWLALSLMVYRHYTRYRVTWYWKRLRYVLVFPFWPLALVAFVGWLTAVVLSNFRDNRFPYCEREDLPEGPSCPKCGQATHCPVCRGCAECWR